MYEIQILIATQLLEQELYFLRPYLSHLFIWNADYSSYLNSNVGSVFNINTIKGNAILSPEGIKNINHIDYINNDVA